MALWLVSAKGNCRCDSDLTTSPDRSHDTMTICGRHSFVPFVCGCIGRVCLPECFFSQLKMVVSAIDLACGDSDQEWAVPPSAWAVQQGPQGPGGGHAAGYSPPSLPPSLQ